jgi:hypothetical protein
MARTAIENFDGGSGFVPEMIHHWREGEEMSDRRPPLGEIVRLLEDNRVVLQRLPPYHQDESVGLLDALAHFQFVEAL